MNKEQSIAKRENAGVPSTGLFEGDANAGIQTKSQEDHPLP